MKEPKLCTWSVYVWNGEEDVPLESIPKEEREEFTKQCAIDILDSYMRQKGYRRCET